MTAHTRQEYNGALLQYVQEALGMASIGGVGVRSSMMEHGESQMGGEDKDLEWFC